MLRSNSLAFRHILATVVLLPVVLGFSAFALDKAFQTSLLSAEHDALQAQLYIMLGAAEPHQDSLFLPEALQEPRFNIPQSGLYGLVLDASSHIIWQSPSLSLSDLKFQFPTTTHLATGQSIFNEIVANDREFFLFIYKTVWEIDGADHYYNFAIVHSQHTHKEELKAYRVTLWQWLGGLTVLLIGIQTIIMHWGLQPLRKLATELQRFQNGQTEHLEGNYPAEIEPVTTNLNMVLLSEKQQRLRYKNTMSDLAHSLKTPLAIIRSSLDKTPDGSETKSAIDEQITRMSEIIGHQLRRATNYTTNVNQTTSDIQKIVNRLGNAMLKVYQSKNVSFDNRVDNGVKFTGDENDLMELLGNIIENAFKYGRQQVHVSVSESDSTLTIHIEDDGSGVADKIQQTILSRGARADTAIPGQGLGLAVSVDIISSYGGSLTIGTSQLGGAKFSVSLPTA